MTYDELKGVFRELKRNTPLENLTAHIIFEGSSYAGNYSLLARTYSVSSDNKAFYSKYGSKSIFAYCLDKTSDQGVRLDWCMEEEGNANGWTVQDCYILEHMRDAAAIPRCTRMERPDGTVCFFFGGTCIKAREIMDDGKISLHPILGSVADCGEWLELPVCHLHGDTCVMVPKIVNDEKISQDVDRATCGEWTYLPIDRTHGYCTLLERHLNAARSGEGVTV